MAANGSPENLFSARLAADPSGPLLTFYDDATGERAELSARSLGNWVAKTHFLLTDSLGLGPGDRAFVRLPVHWLAAPILLGCWFAGLEVSSVDDGVAVAFADADSLAGLTGLSGAEVFAVSLLSMARPGSPPPGAEDYALAARPMPDAWAGVRAQAGPDDPALDGLS
ncbi:MAG: TIGR03089 family protein, partial [Actinomycetota bacterium]|nr:TIGR03089 family protein [Actinomycetota bacterium]